MITIIQINKNINALRKVNAHLYMGAGSLLSSMPTGMLKFGTSEAQQPESISKDNKHKVFIKKHEAFCMASLHYQVIY